MLLAALDGSQRDIVSVDRNTNKLCITPEIGDKQKVRESSLCWICVVMGGM